MRDLIKKEILAKQLLDVKHRPLYEWEKSIDRRYKGVYQKYLKTLQVAPGIDWKNILRDEPTFIIANGPSVNNFDIELCKDFFTIGINRAFKPYLPFDPTMIFWQDASLWSDESRNLKEADSILYCRNFKAPKNIENLYTFELLPGLYEKTASPYILKGRGSTGPLAVLLAIELGCKPIIMMGFDCCYKDGKTDFYGTNKRHSGHTITNCNRGLKFLDDYIYKHKECGIIDLSDNRILQMRSTIKNKPAKFSEFCEILPKKGKSFYMEKLLGTDPEKKEENRTSP